MTVPRLYGVLGWPVLHSRSPAMHEAAFRTTGVLGIYLPLAVAPADLGAAIAGLAALGAGGLNITLPHKTAVMKHLVEVDGDAKAIGAVNTLVPVAGGFRGENTDAPGLARSLSEAGVEISGAEVLVLGAGGAARAAVIGLARAGARRITISARRQTRARELADELGPAAGCEVAAGPFPPSTALLAQTTLLVQATSATLGGGPAAEVFADCLDLCALPETAAVTDLVYEPRVTTVLLAAQAAGRQTVDGLGMLLYQGAIAFERWTGRPAPIDAMREALGGVPNCSD